MLVLSTSRTKFSRLSGSSTATIRSSACSIVITIPSSTTGLSFTGNTLTVTVAQRVSLELSRGGSLSRIKSSSPVLSLSWIQYTNESSPLKSGVGSYTISLSDNSLPSFSASVSPSTQLPQLVLPFIVIVKSPVLFVSDCLELVRQE